MSIVSIAVVLSIFTLLFFVFGFNKVDKTIGAWMILIILLTFVLSSSVKDTTSYAPRTHPSYTLGKYLTL